MYIRTLDGREENMLDVISCERERSVNGEHSIDFTMVRTNDNKHMFDYVEVESTVVIDTEEYIIKNVEQSELGDSVLKRCSAIHRFFCDMVDSFYYGQITGTRTLTDVLTTILADTEWNFFLSTAFGTQKYEEFGDNNVSALFQEVIKLYNAEFTLHCPTKTITIKDRLGSDIDTVFRWKSNIKTIRESIDTSNLSTYIKGFGKITEVKDKDGKVTSRTVIETEYLSPNASIYGKRHAPVVRDERFTTEATLLAYIQKKVDDQPRFDIEIESSYVGNANFSLGDTLFVIHESMGIDTTARILAIKDYPLEPKRIPSLTLGNYHRKTYVEASWDSTKEWRDVLLNGSGKIKMGLLEAAIQIASEAINNALTELEYPENGGIVARDKNNENNIVRFNSAGLGISTDGGETYRTAMTAAGIVADVITAGVINAANVRIFGGTPTEYTDILGNYLESRGVHTRTWKGETTSHDIRLKLENGYFRARNEDKQWSLYFSDYGISTYADGEGNNDASGYIEFHSKDYSPTNVESGLTIGSIGGRVALETDNSRIMLNPKGGSVHVADMKNVYYPISASAFTQSSSRELKRDIKDLEDNALEFVDGLRVREYKRMNGTEPSVLDTWQAGLILEEAPLELVTSGVGIDLYTLVAYQAKAIQELHEKVKRLEGNAHDS